LGYLSCPSSRTLKHFCARYSTRTDATCCETAAYLQGSRQRRAFLLKLRDFSPFSFEYIFESLAERYTVCYCRYGRTKTGCNLVTEPGQ